MMKRGKVRTECSLLLMMMLIFCMKPVYPVHAAAQSTADSISYPDAESSNDMDSYADTDNSTDNSTYYPVTDDTDYSSPEDAPDMDNGWEELPVFYDMPVLDTQTLHLAAGGDSYELHLQNAVSASYQLGSPAVSMSVASLSDETAQSVTITPIAAGSTVLTVTAVGADQSQHVLTCDITVSQLEVSDKLVEIYLNDTQTAKDVRIEGADLDAVYYGSSGGWNDSFKDALTYSSQCSIDTGNEEVADAYFSDGNIHINGYAKGITNVRGTIFGVPFSIKVKVYHYTLNKYAVNTYKGSAKKILKVKGAGNHKVTWSAGNPNVASVSSNGTVTINGIGATKITAKVNGRRLICIVAVSSKTACRAVKNARAVSQKKDVQYSQAYRMSQNYYDCSSLVYRCYAGLGIRFGNTNPHWAPTAAEEGRWCTNTKHVVSTQPVDILSCKLVPGDTIYYSFNGNNGRYLNIDHTAIFAGYAYDESAGYYGTVIEASSSRNAVVERMYYPGNTTKLIGRPSKK